MKKNIENYTIQSSLPLMVKDICVSTELFSALRKHTNVYIIP